MTANARGLSGWEATTALARLSLRRVVRGKTLWVAIGIGLLPCLLALLMTIGGDEGPTSVWNDYLLVVFPLLAIIPPILVASSLSDEIDEKTASYLWSRALPRWSVVSGKLLGLAPIAAGTIVLGMVVSWFIVGGPSAVPGGLFARSLYGVAAGAVAASIISAMFATVAPRFAVPLAIGWLLFDSTIGALDIGIHVITISFGARALADATNVATGVISMAVVTALALAIAVRRVDQIE